MALSIGFYRAEGWSRLALTRQPLEVVDQSDGSTPRSTMGSIAVLGIPYVPGGAIASYGQGDGGGGGGGGTSGGGDSTSQCACFETFDTSCEKACGTSATFGKFLYSLCKVESEGSGWQKCDCACYCENASVTNYKIDCETLPAPGNV